MLRCANEQSTSNRHADESHRLSSRVADQPETPSTAIGINDILEQWSADRKEYAVRRFLQLADTEPSTASYRLFDFSEEYFVSLPEAERDALQEKMLAKFRVLREFARELLRRAEAAVSAGDHATAERLLVNMKRLGAANTGPEVTLVADLVGRKIKEKL
jgi:hypothetical protein